MDIIEIPVHMIDEDTDQPRYQFDEQSLQELMNSIGELGLLSPIKVRTTNNGRYKIIYGNRRFKACKSLGLPAIPCIVSTVTDELEIYLEQIAENLTREGFSPIEEAEAFHKLLNDPKFRSSTKYLSNKLGKPEAYIKNKCDLLKFNNAVKKLIVSGTEIRKDKLTEDQLLPIKDLPMEHRDSLALIIARDELPVSDVKRIARLFKDKDISASTKDKLLYKSGHELLETWSVYEQNRAERSKAAAPKSAAKAGKSAAREETGAAGATGDAAATPATAGTVAGGSSATAVTAEAGDAAASEAAAGSAAIAAGAPLAAAAAGTATVAGSATATGSAIESKLQQLLASLPAHTASAADAELSAVSDKAGFLNGVDGLIASLEKHLAEWKTVREQIASHKQ